MDIKLETELLGRQMAVCTAFKILIAALPPDLAAVVRIQFESEAKQATHGPDADNPVQIVTARELNGFVTLTQR